MRARSGSGLAVLGAGLSGLSAAWHAGPRTRVFEAADRSGGECTTDKVGPYHFDRSGHLLHLRTPEIKRMVRRLLPNAFHCIRRDARVHLLGTEVRYPFQANTFGLAPDVKARCLMDYLAAAVAPKKTARNFSAWAQARFGGTMARLFFEPYNRKLWTIDPADLTLDWMRSYVPVPELKTVVQGAFADRPSREGYNASFFYPKKGGIEILAASLAARVRGLRVKARAVKVDPRRRWVQIQSVGRESWEALISTLPLPALVALLDRPPQRVREAAARLRANSVLVVNLGVRRSPLHAAHWLYFPEEKYIFYRVGFPSNFGRVAPQGCSSLYAEVALAAGTGWDQRKHLARKVKQDLLAARILRPGDIIEAEHCQYLPYAYVIFDRDYAQARKTVLDYLELCGIQSIGRWGGWEYSAMEDALLAGALAAKKAVKTCDA